MAFPSRDLAISEIRRSLLGATRSGDRLLLAFSGGPDSAALLAALQHLTSEIGLGLHAAHLDHALDPDSAARAERCAQIAATLGVPFTLERLSPPPPRGESPEAWARSRRYAFLDRVAKAQAARWILTAHHADDQAETVLLRILFGSGLSGLAGIQPRRSHVLRPALRLRRAELAHALPENISPILDPTNLDLARPRNLIRHHLLEKLATDAGESTDRLIGRLASLADTARQSGERLNEVLRARLEPRSIEGGLAINRAELVALPSVLRPLALGLLHHLAGAPYPASASARQELERQLAEISNSTNIARAGRLGCDCGAGWRWESDADALCLRRGASFTPDFAYTLTAPGEVAIRELGLRVRLRQGKFAPWMLVGDPNRTALAGFSEGCRILIRNRRPGDRLRPLGTRGRRRLKDLLIDRRIPRRQRDRLPLLVVDAQIAWVPGVTIGDRFRLPSSQAQRGRTVWIAEIEPTEAKPFDIESTESTLRHATSAGNTPANAERG